VKLDSGALNPNTKLLLIGAALAALIIVAIISIRIGTVPFSVNEIIEVIFQKTGSDHGIITNIRIPRIFTGIFVGMNLAVAGVLLQGIFRNPMASPNIIGVNAGAGVAAVSIMALFPEWIQAIPVAAFVGALVTAVFVFLIAGRSKTGSSTIHIVLAGVAISNLLKAITSGIMALNSDTLDVTYSWLLGSLSGRSWTAVETILPYSILGIAAAIYISPKLNLFSLGEEIATSVGLKIRFYRMIIIILSAILAGSGIATAGTIGFIGLIAPHISRMIIGTDHKYLVPLAVLAGAILLVVSDTFARSVFQPVELAVGVVTAVLGGPFFLILLRRKKGEIRGY
jgi:iron complex transport system permease protein